MKKKLMSMDVAKTLLKLESYCFTGGITESIICVNSFITAVSESNITPAMVLSEVKDYSERFKDCVYDYTDKDDVNCKCYMIALLNRYN